MQLLQYDSLWTVRKIMEDDMCCGINIYDGWHVLNFETIYEKIDVNHWKDCSQENFMFLNS